jgi:triphosphoribosyl-dephospho-CoA synthetase
MTLGYNTLFSVVLFTLKDLAEHEEDIKTLNLDIPILQTLFILKDGLFVSRANSSILKIFQKKSANLLQSKISVI